MEHPALELVGIMNMLRLFRMDHLIRVQRGELMDTACVVKIEMLFYINGLLIETEVYKGESIQKTFKGKRRYEREKT